MKDCTHCVHAEWHRTEKGRLHPSGDGRCKKEIVIPQLPQAFYWLWGDGIPKPSGGRINRRYELEDHCAYWVSNRP